MDLSAIFGMKIFRVHRNMINVRMCQEDKITVLNKTVLVFYCCCNTLPQP